MAINSATYTGPGGAQTITLSITPQHANDVAFVVTSFDLGANPTGNIALTVTAVANAAGGNTVYTIDEYDGGANNALVNKVFVVVGLNQANTGTYIVQASTTTSLTLNNPNGTAQSGSDGTATCGWISIGGTGGWLWMQQLNSPAPITWEGTLGDFSQPWAALIVTVPTLGVVGSVTFPTEGSAVWEFDTDTFTTAAFSVGAGDSILGFMPLSNDESALPAGPATDMSDLDGNVYQQVYVVNDSVSHQNDIAWFIAAFDCPANAANKLTATMANSVGQNGSIIVFNGLAPVPPTYTITGNFYDLTDSPIANGSYKVTLSEDVKLASGGLLSAGEIASGLLSDEGGLEGLALYSTDPSVMTTFSGNDPYYEITIMNALGITVWHSEVTIPTSPVFLYDLNEFTPPTSYCYNDPGLMFLG